MLMIGNILLVDDDKEITCSFKSILENEGYMVHTANDADEAVRVMRDNEIQLAIMDYVLPKTRGDKLAETLKAINQKLSIIFVSGYLDMLKATDRLDCGVCGVFLKPVSPEILLTRVRSLGTDPLYEEQPLYSYMVQ